MLITVYEQERNVVVSGTYGEHSTLKTQYYLFSHKIELEGRQFRHSVTALISSIFKDSSRILSFLEHTFHLFSRLSLGHIMAAAAPATVSIYQARTKRESGPL